MSKNEDKSKQSKSAKKNVLQGMNITKLSNSRIIQKHLVYVIGLSSSIASKEVKIKNYFFFIGVRKIRVLRAIRFNF
jgi:hypothetical protein